MQQCTGRKISRMSTTESTFAFAVWCVSKRVDPVVDAGGVAVHISMEPLVAN